MLLEITIAIILAKSLNLLFQKLKQPGVLGEIFAGILLGPSFLALFSTMQFNFFNTISSSIQFNLTKPEFKEIALIGAIFLLFIVGLETNIDTLMKIKKAGILIAVFGVIIPFLFGCLVGILFNMNVLQCLALGAIFNATSTTIALRILSDTGILSTKIGLSLRSAIILNDIIAILLFAFIFGTNHSILLLIAQVVVFFFLTIVLGILLIKYTSKKKPSSKTPMIFLTMALMICFLFSIFAENMGLTAIIGAFMAGLIIHKTPHSYDILEHIKTIGYLFFIPLFFVYVGASLDFIFILHSDHLLYFILFIIIFVSFALVGNFLGGTLGAKLSGFKRKESMTIGFGMMPIMGVALIIVTTGVNNGIFGDPQGILANQIKTATLVLIITSCFITPPLLKRSLNSPYAKLLGKTKLKKYNLPHCPKCDTNLLLKPKKQIWYCDNCDTSYTNNKKYITQKQSNAHIKQEKQKNILYLFLALITLLLYGLHISNAHSASLLQKVGSTTGVLLGIFIAYIIIKYHHSFETMFKLKKAILNFKQVK